MNTIMFNHFWVFDLLYSDPIVGLVIFNQSEVEIFSFVESLYLCTFYFHTSRHIFNTCLYFDIFYQRNQIPLMTCKNGK